MTPKKNKGPAEIIIFTNEKGGVGKSTLSVHEAFYLAEQGYKVVGVDLDGQGNFSSRFLPNSERVNGLRAVHLYQDSMPDVKPLSTPSGVDLIYSVNGDVDLHAIEQRDLSVIRAFANNIAALCDEYDYVVIDTPPTSGIKMTGAIFVADFIYVPVELAAFAVDGVRALLGSFTRISRATGKPIQPTGFICNKLNSRVVAHKNSLADLRKEVGPLIMRNSIAIRGSIDTAVTMGMPVWKMRTSGAEREAGREMLLLMEEMAAQCGIDVEIRTHIKAPVDQQSKKVRSAKKRPKRAPDAGKAAASEGAE